MATSRPSPLGVFGALDLPHATFANLGGDLELEQPGADHGSPNQSRSTIADVGLRPYRVFLAIGKYTGPRRKQGPLIELELTELLPRPVVEFVSSSKLALAGGLSQEGTVILRQISRTYTEEQLRGKTLAGDNFPVTWEFSYALQPVGQIHAEFYNPASKPLLLPTAWEMVLRPTNVHAPIVIGPD